MGGFNAEISKVVGGEWGLGNRVCKELAEWVKATDLRILNGVPMAMGRWTWMVKEQKSVIDYVMIGAKLAEEDILELWVEGSRGVEISTDHRLIWAHITQCGMQSGNNRCGGDRVQWNNVDAEQWGQFREIVLTVWNRGGGGGGCVWG